MVPTGSMDRRGDKSYVFTFPEPGKDQDVPHRTHLLIPQYTRFQTTGEAYRSIKQRRGWRAFLWWCFSALVLGALPIAVVWAMTQFQAGQSTMTQRVFTMLWLVSGVIVGTTIPFFGFTFQEIMELAKPIFSYFRWPFFGFRFQKIMDLAKRIFSYFRWQKSTGDAARGSPAGDQGSAGSTASSIWAREQAKAFGYDSRGRSRDCEAQPSNLKK
jgi:hypothetical protein